MAVIIELEQHRNEVVKSAEDIPSGWSAEIIIFPGIRIERGSRKQQKTEAAKH